MYKELLRATLHSLYLLLSLLILMNLEGLAYNHRHAARGFQLREEQTMTRWTRKICLTRRRLFLTSLEQSLQRSGCNTEESVTYKLQVTSNKRSSEKRAGGKECVFTCW